MRTVSVFLNQQINAYVHLYVPCIGNIGTSRIINCNKLSFLKYFFQAIGDVIRTCLGPQAMLKMLMDPMGGIVMTNDGNAILREITVQHPAAKSLIEIARTQDEEVNWPEYENIALNMFFIIRVELVTSILFGSSKEYAFSY